MIVYLAPNKFQISKGSPPPTQSHRFRHPRTQTTPHHSIIHTPQIPVHHPALVKIQISKGSPPPTHRLRTRRQQSPISTIHLALFADPFLIWRYHSSSSSVAVSVAGVGDHDLPLFAISCIHKHLSASSQPGCYTVLYFYSLTTSASFSFDLSCCQQML